MASWSRGSSSATRRTRSRACITLAPNLRTSPSISSNGASRGPSRHTHLSFTTNAPLHRFSAYQPIGIDKRLFTPLERQRLILSILQARPIDDGAAVDTLMATKDERSMAWRMALPPEKQAEQEAFDDALLEKAGIDMETEADLLRYEAKGGSVLTHVFAVHDVRTRYRIHQKWHRGCPRLYGPARTLLYLDDLRDYFGEKVAFYFAFMDHYTRWLAYASAPALVVLIVQVVPFQNLCDQDCTAEARLVTGVDNIMVIPSCVGIAIWAVRATATRYSLLTAHHCHRITHHSPPSTLRPSSSPRGSGSRRRSPSAGTSRTSARRSRSARRSVRRRRRRGGGRRATTRWAAVTHRSPPTARH